MKHSRILVVEDEAIIGADIQRCLIKLGYDVVNTVSTAEEAVEIAKKTPPDLALMDIHLKGDRDGMDLADQFKLQFDIPVIFLTAFSNDSTLERAKQAQPYGYLVKPFSEEELKSNIEMALYKHSAEKAREEDFELLSLAFLSKKPSL